MNSARIVYRPRENATPETELSVLAGVYAFILDSAKKRGRLLDKSGPNNAEKESMHVRAKRHCT